MGWLSKAWKGIKKVVKKVARTVKKVAKKVAYAVPGGKALWKAGGKIGTSVLKAVGKVATKLGPVGMMALSVALTATGVGSPIAGALSKLWSGFGNVAASMANMGNTMISTLGKVGSALYSGANTAATFIGSTANAMGSAISEGAANIMQGDFSAGLKAFTSNMGSALSGEAGMAGVNAAAAQAANASGHLLGQGMEGVKSTLAKIPTANGLPTNALSFDPAATNIGSITSQEAINSATMGTADTLGAKAAEKFALTGVRAQVETGLYGKAGELTLAETGAYLDYGKAGVQAIQPGVSAANIGEQSLNDKAGKVAKAAINKAITPAQQVQEEQGYAGSMYDLETQRLANAYQAQAAQSVSVGNAFGGGYPQGSSSLLSRPQNLAFA